MLTFTIKVRAFVAIVRSLIGDLLLQLISDAGYQGEITSISTASQQLEVFARIMKTFVQTFLTGGEEQIDKNLTDFTVCSLLLFNVSMSDLVIEMVENGLSLGAHAAVLVRVVAHPVPGVKRRTEYQTTISGDQQRCS
jgi:hypothetical protein